MMVLVRSLLFLALVAITVAVGAYLVKRDRAYLRFVKQVIRFTLLLLLAALLFYAFERLLLVVA